MPTKIRFRSFLAKAIAALFAAVAVFGAILFTPPDAHAFTGQPVRIVDPNQPGSPADTVARLLADQIARTQGQTMVVENRPGAGTLIGTEAVSRAAADGNTLLISGNPLIINPLLRKANYHPLTSFEPICELVTAPNVVTVNSASPYRTFPDLLAAARANPGQLTLASIGPGTATQIAFVKFKHAAGIDMTFIPFPGTAPAVNALLGEHVTSYLGNYAVVAEHIKTGRLRALAAAARTRTEALIELPTIAELGYKDFVVDYWIGIFAPARTPKERIARLADWFTAAIAAPDVRAKLAIQGLFPAVTCGKAFAEFLRDQYDEYGRVIREANMIAE